MNELDTERLYQALEKLEDAIKANNTITIDTGTSSTEIDLWEDYENPILEAYDNVEHIIDQIRYTYGNPIYTTSRDDKTVQAEIEQDFIAYRERAWHPTSDIFLCPYCGHRLWAEYIENRRYLVKCAGCNDTHTYEGRWDTRRIHYVTADSEKDAARKCSTQALATPEKIAEITPETIEQANWQNTQGEK